MSHSIKTISKKLCHNLSLLSLIWFLTVEISNANNQKNCFTSIPKIHQSLGLHIQSQAERLFTQYTFLSKSIELQEIEG